MYKTKKVSIQRTLNYLNFKEDIDEGNRYMKRLQYYISLMSDRDISKIKKEGLKRILYFIAKHPTVYYFVWDELNRNISAEPW